jgi:hypothetical protein
MKQCEAIGFQGDVCFFRVDEFPVGDLKQDAQTQEGALAYGEATGHAHQIEEECMTSVEVTKILLKAGQSVIGLHVKKEITIRHSRLRGFQGQEADQDYHNAVTLPPGKYITGIVQEYDPFEKVMRKVVD